jgi:quinol monooxygenase YgiN
MATTSSASTGIVVTMNAFIAPADQAAYLEAAQPVIKAFRENPENLFVVVSVNPTDAGHVRIVHSWKRDATWFGEVRNKRWREGGVRR